MNGGQDLGGMMGFGPVVPEADEPVFHADWEKRVLAINVAIGAAGLWNIDVSRHAREKIDPRQYLTYSYYQIWLAGLYDMVERFGLVGADELADGVMRTPPIPVKRVMHAADVEPLLLHGWPAERPETAPARFKVGDTVRVKNLHPPGHTRSPRYVRGRVGTIDAVRGMHVYPDSNASTLNENPQWLYTVRFTGTELWGEGGDASLIVSVDAFEPYLDAA